MTKNFVWKIFKLYFTIYGKFHEKSIFLVSI